MVAPTGLNLFGHAMTIHGLAFITSMLTTKNGLCSTTINALMLRLPSQ